MNDGKRTGQGPDRPGPGRQDTERPSEKNKDLRGEGKLDPRDPDPVGQRQQGLDPLGRGSQGPGQGGASQQGPAQPGQGQPDREGPKQG